MTITYVEGTLSQIYPVGHHFVLNICNEVGIWSGPNFRIVTKRWPYARTAYLNWHRHRLRNDFGLGGVQFVRTYSQLFNQRAFVVNLVAQSEVRRPIRCRPFEKALIRISRRALSWGATIHLQSPASTQSDNWPDLEDIITRILCSNGLSVTVYFDASYPGPCRVTNSTVNFRQRHWRHKL